MELTEEKFKLSDHNDSLELEIKLMKDEHIKPSREQLLEVLEWKDSVIEKFERECAELRALNQLSKCSEINEKVRRCSLEISALRQILAHRGNFSKSTIDYIETKLKELGWEE